LNKNKIFIKKAEKRKVSSAMAFSPPISQLLTGETKPTISGRLRVLTVATSKIRTSSRAFPRSSNAKKGEVETATKTISLLEVPNEIGLNLVPEFYDLGTGHFVRAAIWVFDRGLGRGFGSRARALHFSPDSKFVEWMPSANLDIGLARWAVV